ncbi:MAG TPA: hypothetical protein DCM50_02670 [Stenotrophomonas sp.]|nr:hypothetical protein [Stenotrophomonas sp.]
MSTRPPYTEPRKNPNPSVVIYGPQGCGKGLHAQALREHFDLDTIVDEWDGLSKYPRLGALVLTNNPDAVTGPTTRAMHFGAAMRELNGEGSQR